MCSLVLNNQHKEASEEAARQFCSEFSGHNSHPTYILGRNIYAENVAKHVRIDGFIDDYTSDNEYFDYPIIKISDVPKNALVLNVAGGRPLSAKRRLDEIGLRNLDYFSFYRFSGFPLTDMRFNEGFEKEFDCNQENYFWIYDLLSDEDSRIIFKKLVSFRLKYDISYLEGFTWKEDVQYFEDFLNLNTKGETFIDVGGCDGHTSLEFIKHCPDYNCIHVFEPEPSNYQSCIRSLSDHENIHIHKLGLSRNKAILRFDVQGSKSKISENGAVSISVDRLDNIPSGIPTFIKMDIEGGEIAAIKGAYNTIITHHPRLAISVYHKPGDFWKIPKLILSIRDDYEIYMRHYTECIYETVMFFLPKT